MNKKFINGFLLASLAVGMSGFLSSCKDYDDDIDQLRTDVAANKSAIDDIKGKIANGAILTSVASNGNGITVTVEKNGQTQTFDITNGAKGDKGDTGATGATGAAGTPGTVWTIETTDNGYFWACNGELTDKPAQGPKGDTGATGPAGPAGPAGPEGPAGPAGPKGPEGPAGPAGTSTNGVQGDPGLYWAPNATGTELVKWVYNATDQKYVEANPKETVKIAIEGVITAALDGNYLYVNGVKNSEGEEETIVISRTGALTSMVFIPDLYVDGVEGTRFAYTEGEYISPVGTDGEGTQVGSTIVDFTIPATSNWQYTTPATPVAFGFGETSTVKFHLNPDNANLTDVDFGFLPIANVEYLSRADAVVPSLVKIGDPVQEGGDLTVTYQVVNPQAIVYTDATTNNDVLPVTALVANLPSAGEDAAATVITSDYLALVQSQIAFKAFSYIPKTGTSTDAHLAKTGVEAVEGTSIVAPFVKTFSIADTIRICYLRADFGEDITEVTKHNFMSLKDAADKWGLTVKYAMMPYFVGDSKTDDSQYAKVDEKGVVTFQYINEAGNWVDCADDDASRSAIGKHPVVVVTLCKGDNVIIAGYVKLEIADKGAAPSSITGTGIVLATEPTFPYVCSSDAKIESTWATTSSKVLSVLGISEAQFKERYEVEVEVEGEGDDATTTITTYTYDATTQLGTLVEDNKYGELVYNPDTQAGPTNGFLTWNYDQEAAEAIIKDFATTRTVNLYRKFVNKSNSDDFLYLGVTIAIQDQPSISYGTLDPVFLAEDKTDEVGMRVPQAKNTLGMNVTDFYAKLADYYENDKIEISYVGETGKNYPKIEEAGIKTTYGFAVAANQMTAAALKELDINTGLTVSGVEEETVTETVDGVETTTTTKVQNLLCGTDVVAKIDTETGVVTYVQSPSSLKILNAGSKFAWAQVQISSTYGSCDLHFVEQQNDKVTIDFVRPVNVTGADGYQVYPNGIDASQEILGSLFSMKDSYGNALFTYNATSKSVADSKGIFDYFKIAKVTVDFTKVNASGVTFKLTGAAASQPDVTKPVYTVTVPATNGVSVLNTVKVVMDYGNEVLEKPQTVTIPVTVEYYWGVQPVDATVVINAFPKES